MYEFASNALVIWPNYPTTWFNYPPADGFNPAIFEIASNASVTWPNFSSVQNSDLPNHEFELISHELTTPSCTWFNCSSAKNFDPKMVAFACEIHDQKSSYTKKKLVTTSSLNLGAPIEFRNTSTLNTLVYINLSNHNVQTNFSIEINSVFTRIWNTDKCTRLFSLVYTLGLERGGERE